MRRPALLLLLFLASTGCHNCDLVEAELRARESDVYQLRDDLSKSQALSEALMRELQGMRQGSPTAVNSIDASQVYPLKQITLGKQTSGLDEDKAQGDELLQVQLEPRDGDNHVIKAPGALHVEALEIQSTGMKNVLSVWDVSPEQLRKSWKSGFLSSAYVVSLPWKSWPTQEKLRVVARFTTSDGRTFEADRDISIRVAPQMPRAPQFTHPSFEVPPTSGEPISAKPKSGPSASWWNVPAPAAVEPTHTAVVWKPKRVNLAEEVELHRPVPIFIPTVEPETHDGSSGQKPQ